MSKRVSNIEHIIEQDSILLYENSQGTNGTLTASESFTGFRYVMISGYVETAGAGINHFTTTIDSPAGKDVNFGLVAMPLDILIRMHVVIWRFSGAVLTPVRQGAFDNSNGNINYNGIRVTRIVGWR